MKHRCPDCGREVAQQGERYGTPERVYVTLHAHRCAGGKLRQSTVTVARKLRRRTA